MSPLAKPRKMRHICRDVINSLNQSESEGEGEGETRTHTPTESVPMDEQKEDNPEDSRSRRSTSMISPTGCRQ